MSLILDCTLRDGGYYTNWDFSSDLVKQYFINSSKLPIDYLELGYRNLPHDSYRGEFFYSPIYAIDQICLLTDKHLAILLDAKSVNLDQINQLLEPLQSKVKMVRLAANPTDLNEIAEKLELIRSMGFITCLNVMYLSTWKDIPGLFEEFSRLSNHLDYLYLVDSFGSIVPQQLAELIRNVRNSTTCNLGFHGHNNLELAFANTLVAIQEGVDIVDSTFTGMGRGAGNLKTELILTYLNSSIGLKVDLDALASVVQSFEALQESYKWGTNLPYMVSGANSLPQKEVMEWVSRRYYSYNSIIQALNNQRNKIQDNAQFPDLELSQTYETGLIIGGGPGVNLHGKAIQQWLSNQDDIALIHASSKNAFAFKDSSSHQYVCLVGNEGKRLEKVFQDLGDFNGHCVLPPFPRKMGTYVPDQIATKTFQLPKIQFTDQLFDSHTVLALSTALELGIKKIYLVGYDGYLGAISSPVEKELTQENESSFKKFQEFTGIELISLTPTAYQNLSKTSIYSQL